MSRRLAGLTLDNLEDLPRQCRQCVFWELDPVAADRAGESGDPGLEKEAWVSQVLLEWGSCGRVAHVDGTPVGYILYGPPSASPRATAFPTSPVSPDAALLMTAYVLPDLAGSGIGRMMVQAVVRDLIHRNVHALEAFGDAQWAGARCVLPADYLRSIGFKTVRPHHRWPRLRLEMRSTATWREDVEVALERLLGQLQPASAT